MTHLTDPLEKQSFSRRAGALAAGLFLLWVPVRALGPSGGGYSLPSTIFNGGGGQIEMTGGGYILKGALGSQGTAEMKGGLYSLNPGVILSQPMADITPDASHPYPVPFIPSEGHTDIKFSRLPSKATLKIYTIAGELVHTMSKNDAQTDKLIWSPVVNSQGQPVASGVYFYIVESSDGSRRHGKLMIIK